MLFGTGRTIINTWSQIGYDIINVTEFRKVLWDAEMEFDANYQKFTEGMFLVKATSTSEAVAALTTDDVNLRNIANAANNPSAWSLPNIFIGVTIGRAILQFSEVFLALLDALIPIALRLFAPFAIALPCCGDVQVNQCYRCHQTNAWNDICDVGWYKHH